MAFEAIRSLADRSGSSNPAIAKYMRLKFPQLQKTHPNTFRTSLANALKTGVKEKQLVKIKASFKINSEWVKKEKAKIRLRENEKKARERKRKKEIEKIKMESRKKEIEKKKMEIKVLALEKIRREKEAAEEAKKEKLLVVTEERKLELKRRELELQQKRIEREEAEKKKREALLRAKILAERIRKRKFPMDDLELILEDKVLGVKCPEHVTKQPYLPYALSSVVPHDERPNSKTTTPNSVINMCTTNISVGNRGLISDALQVYHFFCGDVGYNRSSPLAPTFSLKHLMNAINEIMSGNAKRAHTLPPLICHLFVVLLRVLTSVEVTDEETEGNARNLHLNNDLKKLNNCLSEISWGEMAFCYVDLMEKFYTSDASNDLNALPGHRITLDGIGGSSDDMYIETAGQQTDQTLTSSSPDLSEPDGYCGYLGGADGALHKAYVKLLRLDPCNLSADEVIALLRAMTDDVLGMDHDLSRDIAQRDEELFELCKAKKAAEYQFRKVRFAHEGPKSRGITKAKKVTETSKEVGSGVPSKDAVPKEMAGHQPGSQISDGPEIALKKDGNIEKEKKTFKPTATKKQFDVAEKAKTKAVTTYEKGLKKLVSRSEPIGYDKKQNGIYFFHHDPESLYVEVDRSQKCTLGKLKSWHIIDSKSLFDSYVSSLDIRGRRESELYEALTGGLGSFGLKRHMSDDSKKKNMLIARKKEEEIFSRRLENAKIACTTEEAGGRRSGRLALSAKDELLKIQEEMQIASQVFEIESKHPSLDYHSLTGLQLLQDFESRNDDHQCSVLWNDRKDIDEGIIGILVSKLLSLEDLCDDVAAWNSNDLSRKAWRSAMRDTATAWERGNSYLLGPKDDKGISKSDSDTTRKKQRTSNDRHLNGCIPTLSQVLSELKGPLIELEKRIFSLTGLERAVREADEANENMSVGSSISNEISTEKRALEKAEKARIAWKKKLFSLYSIPTKRVGAIREVLISAIAIARKGDLLDILHDLRAALALHRPGGAGRARTSALALLEKHGGYEKEADQEEGETSNSDDDLTDDESLSMKDDSTQNNVSFLCAEAMMLTGSLDGDNQADRVDWKNAVTKCKTLSRFAALAEALIHRARPYLLKMADDKERLMKAIKYWEGSSKTRNRKSRTFHLKKEKYNSSTEIWADITTTERFVMAKVEGYPWWPASVCIASDSYIASSLNDLNRVLISFVGEQHLHVIREADDMRNFTGEVTEDDLSNFPANTMQNLNESIDLTKRILRGRGKWEEIQVSEGSGKNTEEEEKKSNS